MNDVPSQPVAEGTVMRIKLRLLTGRSGVYFVIDMFGKQIKGV
jgi:hypothetical protein